MFVCVSWERGIRRGSPEGRRCVRELYEALAWVGSKSGRLPVGLWTQGPSVRTASELAAHSSVYQAGEVRTLNADAVSQHLAGILSASQTRGTYLK